MGKHALDIEGLGRERIDMLLEKGLVQHYDEIFTLTEGDLLTLEGFAEISAKKLIASIKKASRVEFARLLAGLSIPHIGEETAILLAEKFRTIDRLAKASKEELEEIDGVGPKVSEEVVEWFGVKRHRELVERLKKVLKIISPSREASGETLPLSGKTYVLTGTLASMSRDEAKEKLRALGAHTAESVSKKTTALIAGENPGSKLTQAESLGVLVLSESGFLKLIR